MAKDRRSMIRAAEKLVARGRLESAIKEYRKVLSATPDDTSTLNRVGDLYARIDRLDEAVEIFSKAADHFVSEGFLVKAIAIFKKIIRLDPTRIAVYETLADLYNRQGLRNEARSQYQVVADYFSQAGDSVKVRSIYERIVELEPNNPSHRVKLAELYCEASMISEATDQYQRIASFMLKHERVEEALKVYRGAFDLSPSDLGFLTDVVLHLKDNGQPEAAEQLLSEAIAKNPDAVRVREVTGLVAAEPEPLQVPPAVIEISPPVESGEGEAAVVAGVDDGEPGVVDEPVAVVPPEEDAKPAPVPTAEEAVSPPSSEVAPPAVADTVAAETGAAVDETAVEESEIVVLDLDSGVADLPFAVDGRDEVSESTETSPVEIDLDAADSDLPFAVESRDVLPELTGASSEELEGDLQRFEEQFVETAAEPVDEAIRDSEAEPETAVEEAAAPGIEAVAEEEVSKVETATGEVLSQEESVETVLAEAAIPEAASPGVVAIEEEAREEQELAEVTEVTEITEVLEVEDVEERVGAERGGEAAAESEVEPKESVDDLISEARMLASYGLDGKAVDLCEQIIDLDGTNLDAYELLNELRHEEGDTRRVAETAMRVREVAGEDSTAWMKLADRLRERAYIVHADRVEAPSEVEEATPEPLVVLGPEPEPVAADQGSPVWLEKEASEEESFAGTEEIFGAEDEFFDLASELEQELQQEEEELSGELLPQLQEQSLEEIVEGFKKGVAETLSEEDYETHYNLGIAYREMGLLDEAIGEFQLAAKAPGYLVDCCSLLGSCFLEKGFPDLAIKWYERGLEAPQVSENESLGLLYELGNLYLITGDKEVAHRTFAEIYGINSNYRDVVAKLEELKAT